MIKNILTHRKGMSEDFPFDLKKHKKGLEEFL